MTQPPDDRAGDVSQQRHPDIVERILDAEIVYFPQKRNASLSDDRTEKNVPPAGEIVDMDTSDVSDVSHLKRATTSDVSDVSYRKRATSETSDVADAGGAGGTKPPTGGSGDYDDYDPIFYLNREYALVMMGSRAVIMCERPDAPVEHRTKILSIEAFKHYLANQRIKIKKRVLEAGEWVDKISYLALAPYWLQNRDRRTYDGVEFFPDPHNKPGTRGYFNLWRGFSVEPALSLPAEERAKKYPTFRDHLLTNICDGNKDHFDWVFAWMAHIVQRPRERAGTAIVLRGLMGTGKTVVGEVLGALFQSHYFLVDDPRYVTGQFNAHMASCLVLHVDEGFWAGDKAAEGRLKGLVTAAKQMIEAKGIDPIRVDSYVRLLFTSNENWVIPAGMDERRFCVFDVAAHVKENHEYFAEIAREMDDGGREAFLADLLSLDLASAPNVRVIPKTAALLEQKLRSFDPITAWLFERVMDGAITKRRAGWPKSVPIVTAHNDFIRQAERQGLRRRPNVTEFAIGVRKLIPVRKTRETHDVEVADEHGTSIVTRRVWCWELPSLDDCRLALENALRQDIDWGEITKDGEAEAGESAPAPAEF